MIDTYADELGFLDFQRSQHGSGMSSRSQVCNSFLHLFESHINIHTYIPILSNYLYSIRIINSCY